MWWSEFKAWVAHPYPDEKPDAAHWFYFLGLLIVLSAAWGLILRTMREHIE